MALTNFGLLTAEQKTIWSMDLWKQARNYSFVNQFLGKDSNSVITLLADLEGDGIAGDRTLEGNEEAMKTYDQVIRLDQLRHANRHEGRMADQKSIVEFRNNSRDVLAYWLADRIDQVAFLTLAGMDYSNANSGGQRIGSDLTYLEFGADVVAPSAKRVARWDVTTPGSSAGELIIGGATSDVVATDYPTWDLFVQLKAYAKDNYIRGVKEKGGEETYHCFLSPQAMSRLKLDDNYMQNLRHAQPRNSENGLFTGTSVKIDGIYFHEFRHVPNTRLAVSGVDKWGAGSDVDGCQMLFCGAQAMGMADIGSPEWVEKGFDYENQQGVSTGKILGFLKPQFYTQYSGGTVEDHGVISVYTAQ